MNIDPDTLTGNWNYPTAMRFGPGHISELAEACKSLGMTKPLLVTDPGLAGGTSRTAATTGCARTRRASHPLSQCRPRRVPAPRSAAPA